MSMHHTYFTAAGLGSRVQYDPIGGTDSLTCAVGSATGTFTVISDSSVYGDQAIQIVTSATPGDTSSLRITSPSNQTERRGTVVLDMPTLSAGQFVAVVGEGNSGGTFYITLYQTGAWAVFCNGSAQYTSAAGILPGAGTTIRIAYSLGVNGSSSTWRATIFDDATDTPLDTERSGTISWSGTLWADGAVGKALNQSATSTTLLIRAIRIENGSGCSLALLPSESLLTPSEGSEIVPIRFVSSTGTPTTPTGSGAVTHLSDANDTTTVTVPTGSSIRVALRPMNVVGPYLTLNLYKVALSTAGSVSVNLWSGNSGLQIGSTKSVSIGTTAADETVTFGSSEISGLTSTDWEAMELEIIVP